MACARPEKDCALSFHQACYSARWLEDTFNRCPCRHCLVCLTALRYRNCVGVCDCGADMHFECAKKLDWYCALCFAPIWPLD